LSRCRMARFSKFSQNLVAPLIRRSTQHDQTAFENLLANLPTQLLKKITKKLFLIFWLIFFFYFCFADYLIFLVISSCLFVLAFLAHFPIGKEAIVHTLSVRPSVTASQWEIGWTKFREVNFPDFVFSFFIR
jgi:hypothetical protein